MRSTYVGVIRVADGDNGLLGGSTAVSGPPGLTGGI